MSRCLIAVIICTAVSGGSSFRIDGAEFKPTATIPMNDSEAEISYILEAFDNVSDFKTFQYNGTLKETEYSAPYIGTDFLRTRSTRVSYLQTNPKAHSHNCAGARRFSLWYRWIVNKTIDDAAKRTFQNETSTNATTPTNITYDEASIQLHLYSLSNDSDSTVLCYQADGKDCVVSRSTRPLSLQQNKDWLELSWNVVDDEQWISMAGERNDTNYLMFLIGWELSLNTRTGAIGELATDGYLFDYDHLSCSGGEELLSDTFFVEMNPIPSTQRKDNWLLQAHKSEFALDQMNTSLSSGENAGILQFDYLVEQTENWGGYSSVSFEAPGYWNLSTAKAISFDYRVRRGATLEQKAVLRFILHEILDDCTEPCMEMFHSFHHVLDLPNDSIQTISIPLIGNSSESAPFWFTGWSGEVDDKILDKSRVRMFVFEFSIFGDLGLNSTVKGHVDLSNLRPVFSSSFEEGRICVNEPELTLTKEGWDLLETRKAVTNCCELCDVDENCLFSVHSVRRLCGTASEIWPNLGKELRLLHSGELEFNRDSSFVSWTSSGLKSTNYCDVCVCNEMEQMVDCRGKNLRSLPRFFLEPWRPKILDLRANDNLGIFGTRAFSEIGPGLETIFFPQNTRYLSETAISDIHTLWNVKFEGSQVLNVKDEFSGMFGDVCCAVGSKVALRSGDKISFCSPTGGNNVGTDSLLLEYLEFINYFVIAEFSPSSLLMPQAAESPAMCAEYCKLNPRCFFFQHDSRLSRAEPICYHFANGAHGLQRSDELNAEKVPAIVAGVAPRARGSFENAQVILHGKDLNANRSNGYTISYRVTLGAVPQRGTVWIRPSILVHDGIGVEIHPPVISLGDNVSVAVFTLTIRDTKAIGNRERVLVVRNNITSCDSAFSSEYGKDLQVRLVVVPLRTRAESANLTLICTSGAMILFGSLLLFVMKRKRDDSTWEVQLSDVHFPSPSVVLGTGTFGLVLQAEWRGTQVAVKRLLPQDGKEEQFLNSDLRFASQNQLAYNKAAEAAWSARKSLLFSSNKKQISIRGMDSAKLKADLISEMKWLSRLRHPNITTVMGALTGSTPMLVMELMIHGSLFDIIHNGSMPLGGDLILPILRDIAQGMRFLHVHKPPIVHGDLKSENCLLDSHFRCKIADFGLSAKKTLGVTGTPYWMDPILLRGEGSNSKESDVYSFGIILFELYSRSEPYCGEDVETVLRLVCDPNINKRPPIPADTPPLIASLMKECYSPNQDARPSFEEIDKRLLRIDADCVEPGESRFCAMQKKSSRNENLLHKVFPKHVADALRDGRSIPPDRRDLVSVCFADIVGFTTISSKLTPQNVTNMLDRLYSKIDLLADKHDVFKIDVIGDCYMCATNLAKDQPTDHAKRIAEFSIDAIAAASQIPIHESDPSLGYITLRCGFHAGPVVAQVVGQNTPKYSVFGDSVNISSRMESSSSPGLVQCSARSAELVQGQAPHLKLVPRGYVSIKGKGNMKTFYVVSPDYPVESIPSLLPPPRTIARARSLREVLEDIQEVSHGDF